MKVFDTTMNVIGAYHLFEVPDTDVFHSMLFRTLRPFFDMDLHMILYGCHSTSVAQHGRAQLAYPWPVRDSR